MAISPSREPPSRRARVEPLRAHNMLSPVGEHVDECVTDLARRPQDASVVPIGPDRTVPSKHTIDGPCNANGQPLNAAPEARRSLRLDEQMHVIHLDTDMERPVNVFSVCIWDGVEAGNRAVDAYDDGSL